MAYGLQVFDSGGNLEIDISSRLSRLVSFVSFVPNPPTSLTAAVNTQTVPVTGILNDGTWAVANIPEGTAVTINSGSITLHYSFYSWAQTETIHILKV